MTASYVHALNRYGAMMRLTPVWELWLNDRMFRVQYENCNIITERLSIGAFGRGATREVAAEQYLREIACKTLRYGYLSDADRREIKVPGLSLLVDIGSVAPLHTWMMAWNTDLNAPRCCHCYHSHRPVVSVMLGQGSEKTGFYVCEQCLVGVIGNAVQILGNPAIRDSH